MGAEPRRRSRGRCRAQPRQPCGPGRVLERDREDVRRGACRGPRRRAGSGGRPLLRRPGCRLDGDGPVLCTGPEASGSAAGVDEGRLPASERAEPVEGSGGPPGRGRSAAGTTALESAFVAVLAEVLGVENVPVDGHLFDDLGADSMVMARFCARVRKRPDLPPVSMKDIYQHPTMRSLATAVGGGGAGSRRATGTSAAPGPRPTRRAGARGDACPAEGSRSIAGTRLAAGVPRRGGDAGRAAGARDAAGAVAPPARGRTCSVAPCSFSSSSRTSASAPSWPTKGYEWISSGHGLGDMYLRSVVVGGGIFVAVSVLPIAGEVAAHRALETPGDPHLEPGLRPVLAGRDPRPQQFLVSLMGGSPILPLYLRALGARVGRGVVIMSRSVPVCTDLLTIGDGTVIRKDCLLSGYRAHAGWIQTGAVTLGKDVVVAESTVIDIETSIGDGGQLGRSSSLHPGQAVPAGERWHGSPARPTDVDYRTVGPARCGRLRRAVYCLVQLAKSGRHLRPTGRRILRRAAHRGTERWPGRRCPGSWRWLTWRFPPVWPSPCHSWSSSSGCSSPLLSASPCPERWRWRSGRTRSTRCTGSATASTS